MEEWILKSHFNHFLTFESISESNCQEKSLATKIAYVRIRRTAVNIRLRTFKIREKNSEAFQKFVSFDKNCSLLSSQF